MSTYVYIAFEGLRASPISEEAWLSAVQQCSELVVDQAPPPGGQGHRVVRLKKNRRATLRLDRFGIAGARNPSRELIAVMFKVASFLGANVYSEHFNKYASTADWLRRRANHRQAFNRQRAYREKRQLSPISLLYALCAASALFVLVLVS